MENKTVKNAGILMPISSLPGAYGIGDFGPTAYNFVDIIAASGFKIWQILPLNPLGFANSPYQPLSSFAGDEIFISPELLINLKLIRLNDILPYTYSNSGSVDFKQVRENKDKILKLAFKNFATTKNVQLHRQYQDFIQQQQWLNSYAIFTTFKKINCQQPWNLWPNIYKNWLKQPFPLNKYQSLLDFEKFVQFIFYQQWQNLKQYANTKKIAIMGDLPIYVGLDSHDVWTNQSVFLLNTKGKPLFVAGVPPDYFAKSGQRWGNPLYNWQQLIQDDFSFWIERLARNMQKYDIIRLDHFRALDTFWQIPARNKTAIKGTWELAPGTLLLQQIYKQLPQINLVAEDLGYMRQEVYQLRDAFNLKGMKVFQFLFNPRTKNKELLNTNNAIVYSGTHDNDTLVGWFTHLDTPLQNKIISYFKVAPSTSIGALVDAIIYFLLQAQANTVIIPIQDILHLDSSSRINTPGTIGAPNWQWRLRDFTSLQQKTVNLYHLLKQTQRI
ncbi:MAG: 4-alpha-glucanotransferase [Burkholderiales bacterium]|nr:4-alpha-glucanotransferase [Burkholderiales bacterium]